MSPLEEALIDAIYAATVDERGWQILLDALAQLLPDGSATLFHHDAGSWTGAFDLTSGIDRDACERFRSDKSLENPWMSAAVRRDVGVGVVSEAMYPRKALVRHRFYQEFMRPQGMEGAVGVTVARENSLFFFCSIITSEPDPEATAPVARLLTELHPHLFRAFRCLRQADGRLSAILTGIFDSDDRAVLIVGENRILKYASAAGLRLCESGDPLRLNSGQRINFRDPLKDDALGQMLSRNPLQTTFKAFENSSETMILRRIQKDGISTYFEGPTVAILFERRRPVDFSFAHAKLVSNHRLSPAEARALAGILNGQRVSAIAARSGTSVETVRTQIKGLYRKLGVASVPEVIRLAAKYGVLRS